MDKQATARTDSSSDLLLSSINNEPYDIDTAWEWKEKPRWYRSNLRGTWSTIAFIAAIIALATIVAVQSLQFSTRDTAAAIRPLESAGCGNTSAEASALGCVFDYMNFSWEPAECYYPELDAKYSAMLREDGPVQWWADANLTQPIPDDPEILKTHDSVYTERRFHYKHCIYDQELLHLSYDQGIPLPGLMSHAHTLHCAEVLENAIRHDNGEKLLIENAVTWHVPCVWPRL